MRVPQNGNFQKEAPSSLYKRRERKFINGNGGDKQSLFPPLNFLSPTSITPLTLHRL